MNLKKIIEQINSDNKNTIIALFEVTEINQLWNHILYLQSQIYFSKENDYIENNLSDFSPNSMILDVGGGNGDYISRYAQYYPSNYFTSIELNTTHLNNAKHKFHLPNLDFRYGNIENLDYELLRKYDFALLKFVLQHLEQPLIALNNIYSYLKCDGKIIIIESADDFRISSFQSTYLNEIFGAINQKLIVKKVNRLVSFEIMEQLSSNNSELSQLYKLESSNIDNQNNIASFDKLLIKNQHDKKLMLVQKLIFFTIWKKAFGLDINLHKIFNIYMDFLSDENAYLYEGTHFLVLKKISN